MIMIWNLEVSCYYWIAIGIMRTRRGVGGHPLGALSAHLADHIYLKNYLKHLSFTLNCKL